MRIQLRQLALESQEQAVELLVKERLPSHFVKPCTLHCCYTVKALDDYYLLDLKLTGNLAIYCQRCSELITLAYGHEARLAICRTDAEADRLMSQFETVVEPSNQLDLLEIVTDELHLSAPVFHEVCP